MILNTKTVITLHNEDFLTTQTRLKRDNVSIIYLLRIVLKVDRKMNTDTQIVFERTDSNKTG